MRPEHDPKPESFTWAVTRGSYGGTIRTRTVPNETKDLERLAAANAARLSFKSRAVRPRN